MNKQYFFYFLLCLGLLQTNTAKAQQYPITFVDLEALDILMTVGLIDTSANTAIRTIFSAGQPYPSTSALVSISQNALVSHGIHLVSGTAPSVPSDTCWRIARLELGSKSIHAVSNVPIDTDGDFSTILDSMRLDSLKYLDLSDNALIGNFRLQFNSASRPATATSPKYVHTFNVSNNWLGQDAFANSSTPIFPHLDTMLADNFTGIKKIPRASQRRDSIVVFYGSLPSIINIGSNPQLKYLDISNTYFSSCDTCVNVLGVNMPIAFWDTLIRYHPQNLYFENANGMFQNSNPILPENNNLIFFKCTNCNISGFTNLRGFPNLETLVLDSNAIDTLEIPSMSSLNTYPSYELGSLKELNLSHNKLSGDFPLHWFFGTASGNISRPIQKIYLQHNRLSGINTTMLLQMLGISATVPSAQATYDNNNFFWTPTQSSAFASATTISTNALSIVRLDHNNFDFADLYAFNVSMGLHISPVSSPQNLINMPVDTVRGSNYQNISTTHTSAVYYHPQDSLGIGGVRRRAAGERTRFELASSDPLLDFSLQARQRLLSQAPYANTIQRNGYIWYNTDSSNSNRRNLVVFTPSTTGTGSARVIGTINTPNNIADTLGIMPIEPGYARPLGLNDEGFAGAYLERLNPLLERSKLGISSTNANFPALQLHAKLKTIMTGGCMDSLGRAVRCQEISIQYDTAYINQNRGNRSVEEFKKALRDTAGAYVLETCVCGNAELWALYDTTQMDLHLLSNQANYGSQTATTASMTRRPGLKSADMNYVIVPNMDEAPNTPNDSVAYANASVQKRRTLIAHLDSGVNYDLPALMPYLRRNNSDLKNDTLDNDANGVVNDFIGYNFFDRNSQPADDLGHGTQIAGILAGLSTPSVHAIGANQAHDTVDILPVRFTNFRNEGTSYNAACGIYYAAEYHRLHNLQTGERTGIDSNKSPVRVINASWGYQGEECKLLYDAIKYAGEECNILFVTAAGNDNRADIDLVPFYPANYKLKNVLVVASVDNDLNHISAYSNLGSSNVDIAALGTISSTTTIDGYTTATIQGTSFSTPMVARAAGILFNKYPDASLDAVKTALLASAQRINGHDSVYIRSKGSLNLDAAFVYLDSLTHAQRVACATNQTDSSFVNHHVGVVVTDSKTELTIYPNPVQDQLHIAFESNSPETVNIRILDIQGRVLLQKSFAPSLQNFELSTASLAQGFYLLHIHQGSQQWAAKLVKL